MLAILNLLIKSAKLNIGAFAFKLNISLCCAVKYFCQAKGDILVGASFYLSKLACYGGF